MQTIFNCCHGMFDSHAGRWICSSQVSDAAGCGIDEEIIGDEGPAYKPHIQSLRADGDALNALRGPRPAPVGRPGGPQDEKESAKQRLQHLIRDFAHDAVGPGIEVEAQSQVLCSGPVGGGGTLEALLRMDRRLSRLELWPPTQHESTPGAAATMAVPLQQVEMLVKGSRLQEDERADPARDSSTLTVVQRGAHDLRLIFDSPVTRDRAYTCLRIFQMSVDQSLDREISMEQSLDREDGDPSIGVTDDV
eukprot:TRINITY_DN47055_c0_g1_i1.p2 TRINITY_DN47055_c0_g1~~TRINITY_DN47055_c0_g1_i1.p2  ORF type:complete len:249 (+),score=47.04 TRINITY_DN47055_c0_g1_i1:319-1065(+)